jgi:hypothetical protein
MMPCRFSHAWAATMGPRATQSKSKAKGTHIQPGTAAEAVSDSETTAVPEEQAAAPAADEADTGDTNVSTEEDTNAAPAAVLEFGAEPAAASEEAPVPVSMTEEPSDISQENTADVPAEDLPDDIPEEGFYALLYDLDEMMKLGII